MQLATFNQSFSASLSASAIAGYFRAQGKVPLVATRSCSGHIDQRLHAARKTGITCTHLLFRYCAQGSGPGSAAGHGSKPGRGPELLRKAHLPVGLSTPGARMIASIINRLQQCVAAVLVVEPGLQRQHHNRCPGSDRSCTGCVRQAAPRVDQRLYPPTGQCYDS